MSDEKPRPPLWLLIDVSNWAYRDLLATGPGSALPIFTRRVQLCRDYFRPERIVLAFDSPTSFRQTIEPGYKANRRKEPPVGLRSLITGIERYAIDNEHDIAIADGFEADDVIASIAAIGVASDRNVLMASSDKDLRQCLVEGRVSQLLGIKRNSEPRAVRQRAGSPECEYMTAKRLKRDFGLDPDQWPEFQLLVGDATDNIRGCESVGEKSALELLSKCGTIRGYFTNPWAADLSPKIRAKLTEFRKADLGKTRRLVTLRTDVPLPAAWRESVAS